MKKDWFYKDRLHVRPILTYDDVDNLLDYIKRCNGDLTLYKRLYAYKLKMEIKENEKTQTS